MFLSLSTWMYDHLSVQEMVERIAKLGFRHVEISGYDWPSKWKWRELTEACARNGIKIESVHCVHHEQKEWELSDFRSYHEKLYESIGPLPGLILVEHLSMRLDRIEENLRQLNIVCDLAEKYGYVMTTENLPDTPDEQMEVLEAALSDQVRFTFDAAHAAYISMNPLDFLRFSKYIVNVHAYDVDRQLLLGDWLPCGLGTMDWPSIIEALKQIDYSGPITIELNERQLRRVIAIVDATFGGESCLKELPVEDQFVLYSKEYLLDLIRA